MIDQARLNRIRWRARRGLLENDIVLEKYFARYGEAMTEDDIAGLDALLELSDNDLLDLILARKELNELGLGPNGPTAHVLNVLRTLQ